MATPSPHLRQPQAASARPPAPPVSPLLSLGALAEAGGTHLAFPWGNLQMTGSHTPQGSPPPTSAGVRGEHSLSGHPGRQFPGAFPQWVRLSSTVHSSPPCLPGFPCTLSPASWAPTCNTPLLSRQLHRAGFLLGLPGIQRINRTVQLQATV